MTPIVVSTRRMLRLHALYAQTQQAQQQFHALRDAYLAMFRELVEDELPDASTDDVEINFAESTITLKVKPPTPPER